MTLNIAIAPVPSRPTINVAVASFLDYYQYLVQD